MKTTAELEAAIQKARALMLEKWRLDRASLAALEEALALAGGGPFSEQYFYVMDRVCEPEKAQER